MATGDKVYIADKPTLDGVNTKVGTNADLAGTTTVFARVRQIYEYMVNTLLTAINGRQASWGAVAGTKTNIDNTATTVGTINTNVNTINTKIGASTDTGTTTLFGVIKQNQLMHPTKPRYAQASCHSSTIDVVNVTGSGILTSLSYEPGMSNSNPSASLVVIVDGVSNTVMSTSTGNNGQMQIIVYFKNSLIVRHQYSGGTVNYIAKVGYSIV